MKMPFLQLCGCIMFISFAFVSHAQADGLRCNAAEKIEIAAEDAFFPYSGIFEGDHRGYSYDIVRAAYAAVGCELVLRTIPYNRCMFEVKTSRLLGCFNTTNSEENKRKYLLHKTPLFFGKILVYAREGSERKFTKENYQNSRFAVVQGYTYSDEFDENSKITKVEVDSDLQTLALVATGRADYALVYEKVALFQMAGHQELIKKPLRPVDIHATYGLFVSFSRGKGEEAQRAADLLDQGLSKITINGVYSEIEEAWFHWLKNGMVNGEPAPYWQVTG